jgi:plastocyanin
MPHLKSSRTVAVAAVLAAMGTAYVAGPALSKTRSVEVGDNYFVRDAGGATVKLKKGARLKWEWEGKNPHDVTVKSGPSKFHSTTKRTGTYSHRFTRRGTYVIYCTVHGSAMSMKVKVS